MATKTSITAHYLRSRLDYDPETGIFTWKPRVVTYYRDSNWNKRFLGKPPGSLSATDGYLRIIIDCQGYLAHRLAWLHFYGQWPVGHIDHIDENGSNNRIANLRLATHAQNLQNRGKASNNKSGYKGVCWDKSRGRWIASIGIGGKAKRLGTYRTREEAAAAYAEAAKRLHGDFANTGR